MKRGLILLLTVSFLLSSALAGEIDSFLQSRSVIAQIYFQKGGWDLSAADRQILQNVTRKLLSAQKSGRLIRVEGFASSDGSAAINYQLSLQRANGVKNYLEQQGIATELFLSGYGEKNVSTGKLSEQRRVDIAVYQGNQTVEQLFLKSGTVERFVIQ